MIHIKDISGNIILSVSISQECEHVEELMKSDYIQLSWSSDNSDTIPAGSYIEYKDEKYSLLEPYSPKQKDEAEFIYQPQFQSKIMIWGKTPFFMYTYTDDVITNREPDWSLTDNPANFMSVVVDAIKNETGEVWTYSVESSLLASTTQSFQSIDIFSALNQIANTFETEWWVDKVNKVIHLSKASHGDPVVLEVGENVNTPSVTSSKEGYYTRFYAFGSTRNIVQDYKGANVNNLVNKRLTLDPVKYPGGYKDIRDNLSSDEIFSKVLILDDIYPSFKLKISDVRVRLMWTIDPDTKEKVQIGTDNEGNPIYDQYAIWYFQIPGFFFDNTAYDKDTNPQGMLIPGKTLSAHFQNGPLSGREFELKYHDKAESVDSADGAPIQIKKGDYEILFVKEDSLVIPMINNLVPADGNEVVLFNIRMPEEYTTSAYLDLESALNKEIERLSSDLNNYQFNSNPVAFDNSNPKLSLGRNITYKNGTYSYSTRVIKLVTKLDFEIEQTITVGNEQIKGNTQEIKEEIASANKDINLLAILNSTTNSLTQAYSRTQQLMLEGFASIKDMWKFDPDNADTIFSKYNVYSKKALSAKGLAEGSGGGGGGTSALYQLLDVIPNASGTGVEGAVDKSVLTFDGTAGKWKAAKGLDEEALGDYLTINKYATQDWVSGQGYLTQHQSLANYVTLNTAQEITGDKTFFSSNGNLRTVINGRDIITVHNSNYVGGWTRGIIFRKADGATNYGTFGAYGSDQALNYLYIGQSYASPWITFRDTLVKSTVAFEALSIKKTGGTSAQFLKADGSVDSNTYLTTNTASNTYVKVAGDTMTGALSVPNLTISSTDGIKHIAFSRTNYNYITAPGNSSIAFVMHGKSISSTSADFVITNNGIFPGTTGVVTNGRSTERWSNVFSVLGNFSGVITAGSSINAAGTINSGGNVNAENYIVTKKGWFQNDSVGGGLYNKGGDARWFYDGFQWYADKTIYSTGNVNGDRLISRVATGYSPLIVTSSTVVSNLNANYVEGYSSDNLLRKRLIGNRPDYERYVILLFATDTITTQRLDGYFYTTGNGTNRYYRTDVSIWHNRWNSAGHDGTYSCINKNYQEGGLKLITVTYQGKEWVAMDSANTSVQAKSIYFAGDWSSNIQFTLVSYYNSQTKTVLNAEINDSRKDLASDNILVGNNTIAYISSNVASATKLQYARKLWGASFDGTSDIAGDISGATRIYNAANSNFYIGNSSNTGWVFTQNIASHDAINNWSIRTSGVGHFKRINLGDTENDNANYRLLISGNQYISGNIVSAYYSINYSTTNPYYNLTKDAKTVYFQLYDTKAYLGFGTANSLNITQDGKVGIGIGTTNPSYKLHVAGTGYFSGSLTTSGNIATGGNDGAFVRIGNVYLQYDATNNAIKVVKYDGTSANLYATGGLSAKGLAEGSGGGGGGGLIQNVYGYNDLGKTYSNADLDNTFNAYTINQLATRITSLEGGSALSVNTTGTGNAVTSVTKSGTAISVVKGTTFLTQHQSLAGYATEAYVQTYAPTKTGGGASGTWGINITGNANSATSLQNIRTIGISGGATGSPTSFNGTSNITIPVTKIDPSKSYYENGKVLIKKIVTQYTSDSSDVTGIIKIILPASWSATMMGIEIDIYDYSGGNGYSKVLVGGYNYTSQAWYNTSVSILGNNNYKVRLGYDGSKCCILLGSTTHVWHYPKVIVRNVMSTFSGYMALDGTWSTSVITSETGLSSIVEPIVNNQMTVGTSRSCSGNASTATNISNTGTVTLGSPTENNAITITQPSYTTGKPVKLLTFNWYSDPWSIGNIRNGDATSLGLGIFNKSVEIGRFTVNGWEGNSKTLRVVSGFDPANLAVDTLKVKAYDSYAIANTPSTYGNVLEINGISGHWKPQLWFDGSSTGSIRHRNRNYNATSWGDWYTLLDTNNYAATLNSAYVKKSGDTMTGSLTVNQSIILIQDWVKFNIAGRGLYNVSGDARWFWDGGSWYSDKNIFAAGNITGTRLMSNVAQGTSPLVVTSTTQVTNLNADLHDGYHASGIATANTVVIRDANNYTHLKYISSSTNTDENGDLDQFIVTKPNDNFYRKYSRDYVRTQLNNFSVNRQIIDLTSLDDNTYYPCSLAVNSSEPTTINIFVALNSGSKPSWSSHSSGFTMSLSWQVFGGGWGTVGVQRKILNSYVSATSNGINPCGGIEQNTMASTEIVYLRGGAKYFYTVSNNQHKFTVNSSGYSWTSGNYSYSAPTMSTPKKHPSLCYEASSMLGAYNLYSNYLQTGSVRVDGTVTATTFKTKDNNLFENGRLELSGPTPYIDFHHNNSTADYTHRIIAETADRLNITTGLQVNGILYGKGNLNIGSTIVSNVLPTGTNTWSNLSTLSPVLSIGNYNVAKDSIQPIFRWANQIPEGYISRYIIGSHRPSSAGFGQLRLWVGNNDAGTTGNWFALNNNGVVSTSTTYFETSNTGFKTGNAIFGNISNGIAEISSVTNELVISGYTSMQVNDRSSGTGRAIPTSWSWRAGTNSNWATFHLGNLNSNGSIYTTGNLTTDGIANITRMLNANGGLTVVDLALFNDDVQVDGYSAFNSDVTINANVGMYGTIELIGGTIRGNSSSKIICDGIGISAGNKESGCIISGNPNSWSIAIDHNDIQARNNGAWSILYINDYGGDVSITNSSATYSAKILSTKASTSYTTGALTVGGGIGVGGSIYAKNNIVANGAITAKEPSTSDIRLKNNIRDFNASLILKEIGKPFTFEWNNLARELNSNLSNEYQNFGVSAQRVKEILPGFAFECYEGGYLGVKYDRFMPIVMAAQLETMGEVEMLKREIKELKDKIKVLEERK